jgi:surface protein
MIQEKQKISGTLNSKQSLNGTLSNSVIYVDPITQEKTVIPTTEQQIVTPDEEYTGLSKVTVEAIQDENLISENIKNGVDILGVTGNYVGSKYAPSFLTFNGFKGTDLSYEIANVDTSNLTSMAMMFYGCINIQHLNLKGFVKSNVTSLSSMFGQATRLQSIDMSDWDTSNVTEIGAMFTNCKFLESVNMSKLKFGELTYIINLFSGCSRLTGDLVLPEMNISKCTSLQNVFYNCKCSKIIGIENWDTSNITTIYQMFSSCGITELDISKWDLSKVTTMSQTFGSCYYLINLSEIDASNTKDVSYMFTSCRELTNFGGLKNLGQGYLTTNSANYSSYKLDLSASTKLTEQSIINVLNKLYDIKTKGCKTQQVVLGSTNIAKLTSTEGQEALTNAQAKGWTVS